MNQIHKRIEEVHNKKKMIVLNISSKSRNKMKYTSSTYFRYEIPNGGLKNVESVKLIGGHLPNFLHMNNVHAEPYLFLEIDELNDRNVFSHDLPSGAATAVIRYPYDVLNTEPFIRINPIDEYIANNTIENSGLLRNLTIKILDSNGEIFKFGDDLLNVVSFTNANPTEITTSIVHNLTNGDKIFIEDFKNGSSQGLNNMINRKSGFPVTVTGANTFTIPVDLSNENINQRYTIDEAPYQLGRNVKIKGPSGFLYFTPGVSSFSTTNPTEINLGYAHQLTTGMKVRIQEFNNGTNTLINQQINQIHTITVTGANTFTIPVDLSGQVANQAKTNTRAPFPLGEGSLVLVESAQISIDLLFQLKMK